MVELRSVTEETQSLAEKQGEKKKRHARGINNQEKNSNVGGAHTSQSSGGVQSL